ncbi:hypothetical protein GCM10009678_85810 [Actinomadura kijaniata]|uniref:Uncharacterized protein n=1 Tax=Actinomadura namibiensis TaxID=182080 RepID=A0A7W3QSI8_ACTNM|nr:hypothetical protein [Actinomadura namibiensis]MBA8957672.1 hypothetical protein [Actinomadura namibiensis]
MSEILQLLDATVRAAVAEDQAFSDLMPRLMHESQQAPPAVLTMGMTRLGEGIAAAPPNLGCWLAIIAGAWAENGAATFGVDEPVLRALLAVAETSAAFEEAWRSASGAPVPSPVEGAPSQEIVNTVSPYLPDPVGAMLSWFAMEKFALSANTMLSRSPRLRASVTDRDGKAALVGRLAEHCHQMGWVASLLRVLEDERLLVLDRATGRGWTVTIGGIGDNFQLHVLLGGVLLGRSYGMPGDPYPPEVIAWFTDADAPDDPPIIESPWGLHDAHGERVYNEGAPADIPAVAGTRVLVLDPPPYRHTFKAGRKHPMLPGSLTLDGLHLPEDLTGWWPHVKPAAG